MVVEASYLMEALEEVPEEDPEEDPVEVPYLEEVVAAYPSIEVEATSSSPVEA